MRLKELLRTLFGEFSWTPPAWLQRIDARHAGWRLLVSLGLAGLVAAGYLYYQSLPKPLRVAITVRPPGITAIVNDELKPGPARLRLPAQSRSAVATSAVGGAPGPGRGIP